MNTFRGWFERFYTLNLTHVCLSRLGLKHYCHIFALCLNTLHTLSCQKYSLTHPSNANQVFQSLPWPRVYKSKHLGMQTVSPSICERMGRSQELSEFQRGSVIGCRLCNKSSREISSLLNIPQSAVSGAIAKWKSDWERQQLSHKW